jgi:TatD DNase family protein
LKEVAKMVPIDRLLIETDSPFLAPVPYRGNRNEPAYVVRVAETAAELRGTDAEAIGEAARSNFKRLFNP